MNTLLLIFLLILGSIALFAVSLTKPKEDPRLTERLSTVGQPKETAWRIALKPVAMLSRALIGSLKLEEGLKMKLGAARMKLAAAEFFAFKIILIALLVWVTQFFFVKVNPLAVVGAILLGYIIPDIILNNKIKKRKAAIGRVLPETVDILGLCIEAGLDFSTAMRWVIEKTRPTPLTEELGFILEEIKWGKPRVQALRDMSKRLNVPEVSSFVQTLVQAERMGTPISEAFMILSEDTRMMRFQKGERLALQAPIKILFPLVFCILPVIAIIIGAPILLKFMSGGLMKF